MGARPATVPARAYRLDGRCKAARAIKAERARLLAALGSRSDPLTLARVDELAQLRVIAAEMRAKALVGTVTVDTDRIAKLQHTIERVSRLLGLDKPREPMPPDLRTYLAGRASLSTNGGNE